jgi:hypothetical protein
MRSYLRFAAVVGAVTLGAIAAAPALAATDNQAGANAVFVSIAGNGQGTGNVTASYSNGKETTTGNSKPAFPDPTGQKFITGGVLAQEATAKPGFSAACSGLAGDGGSVLNIGDSSCLQPGNLVTGSFGSFDPSTLIPDTASLPTGQLPQQAQDLLTQLGNGATPLTDLINTALSQAKEQFGDGGLVANLDMVEGRCTAGDGGPTGTSTLTDASLSFNIPGQDPITVLTLPVHPKPNTHLFTNLSDVMNAILDGVDADLTESLQGNASPLKALTEQVRSQIVTQVHTQLESQLAPLEQNLLDITLNQQVHPTRDSIKVRALDVQVLPAAKAQLDGNSLVNLQVGNAACAPVARVAVAAPTAEAAAPQSLPTAVSAGLATAPGDDDPHSGIALVALAMMFTGGTALVVIRWLRA